VLAVEGRTACAATSIDAQQRPLAVDALSLSAERDPTFSARQTIAGYLLEPGRDAYSRMMSAFDVRMLPSLVDRQRARE